MLEDYLIWLVTILIALSIALPYFIKFRKKMNQDRSKKQEAQRLGADKPIAQFPQIDQLQCIGCGSCVEACPEGGVLGIVQGRATIINGLKCVGHGMCAEACPVGAITVGLGDISKRPDIPLVDDNLQTNIEGIYIAGELGGLALIRNAIAQGAKAGAHIARVYGSLPIDDKVYHLVIIGAGPAGLSAALTAVEHRLNYIVIDQQGTGGTILHYPRKKLVLNRPVEIPLFGTLDKTEYTKEELLEIWKEIELKFELNLRIQERLLTIRKESDYFTVTTDKTSYKTRAVLLALGRRGTPRKLNVPGENRSKVMYRLLDAESYRNENILVVGGGDSAIEAAIGLARQPGNQVTISYRKDRFFRIKQRNAKRLEPLLDKQKIQVLFNSNVKEIREKSVVLTTANGETELANDYVFIFAGGEPPFALLKSIGIRFGNEPD